MSYSVVVSVFSYSKGLQLNFITYPINLFVLRFVTTPRVGNGIYEAGILTISIGFPTAMYTYEQIICHFQVILHWYRNPPTDG